MIPPPWHRLLSRNAYALFFSALSLGALGFTLYSIIDARYQRFQDHHMTLARHAVVTTAQEIQNYFATEKHLLDLFVSNHRHRIQALIRNPNDPKLSASLLTALKLYIPEASYLTLADINGQILIPDEQNQIGRNCRLDIQHFITRNQARELFIHRNPETQKPHIDILSAIGRNPGKQHYTILVSLDTAALKHLLTLGETLGHQLMILKNEGDEAKVELTTGRQATPDTINLNIPPYRDSVMYSQTIPQTRWMLVSLLDPQIADEYLQELTRDAVTTYLFFIGINIIFLAFLFRTESRRLASEQEIIQLNQNLEQRIRERTQELEEQQELLKHQATHDHLTGLINRVEFENQLERLILTCQNVGVHSAILYIDLDQFKVVNDTAGHLAGDRLLFEIAQIIASAIRPQDILARIGGDEFGVLFPRSSLGEAARLAEKIRKAIENHAFHWEERRYQITASIGIVPIDEEARDSGVIMSSVDALCYSAKHSGRNLICVLDPEDSHQSEQHKEMHMASYALQAIEEDRLELHFQKVLPIQSADTDGAWAEVLVRIRSQEGELIYPGAFIPALENYGGIRKLDHKVLESTIRYMSQHPDWRFNINLSRASICDREFSTFITRLIEQYKVDPGHIVLEITETATVINLDMTRNFITEMKRLGCQVALDDFGSGMSSFSFLSTLDFDYIKLDGSFVRDIDHSPTNQAIVQAICSVSRVMGKKTIAEFVENETIAAHLSNIGIDFAQGYHFHRPEALPD